MPDEQRAHPAAPDPYAVYELPVEGFQGTIEEIEHQWYEQCYLGRGDTVKQLTWRAVIGMGWQKRNAKHCEEYLFPAASGIVAGGALMGVILVFWENGQEIVRQLLGR